MTRRRLEPFDHRVPRPLRRTPVKKIDSSAEPVGEIETFYVPHSVHMYFCGNKSGKKPAWL